MRWCRSFRLHFIMKRIVILIILILPILLPIPCMRQENGEGENREIVI